MQRLSCSQLLCFRIPMQLAKILDTQKMKHAFFTLVSTAQSNQDARVKLS
jgi:hypothetical protein